MKGNPPPLPLPLPPWPAGRSLRGLSSHSWRSRKLSDRSPWPIADWLKLPQTTSHHPTSPSSEPPSPISTSSRPLFVSVGLASLFILPRQLPLPSPNVVANQAHPHPRGRTLWATPKLYSPHSQPHHPPPGFTAFCLFHDFSAACRSQSVHLAHSLTYSASRICTVHVTPIFGS